MSQIFAAILMIIAAAVLGSAIGNRAPLARESRIVIDRQPIWRLPTARGWAVIFFMLIGLTGAAVALFSVKGKF